MPTADELNTVERLARSVGRLEAQIEGMAKDAHEAKARIVELQNSNTRLRVEAMAAGAVNADVEVITAERDRLRRLLDDECAEKRVSYTTLSDAINVARGESKTATRWLTMTAAVQEAVRLLRDQAEQITACHEELTRLNALVAQYQREVRVAVVKGTPGVQVEW